jgi:hypothetical protein
VFFVFCLFLSSLVWFFLWLPEEELTLLFLLHCENGDFSILMKDISPLQLKNCHGQTFCRSELLKLSFVPMAHGHLASSLWAL